jgi:hypothetical protein
MKDFLIYMTHDFEIRCGGLVVQYELAKQLLSLGYNVKIITPNNIHNDICTNYLDKNEMIDFDKTVVIYGECIYGNPLNAKYVVRWILAPIGICSSSDITNSWGKNDLVYYFNYEEKFNVNTQKIGNVYKLLNIFYINPLAQNNNKNGRIGFCHTFRKINYHKKVTHIHPDNSFEIKEDLSQVELISCFNQFKYFISYDPVTFLSVIAALCGCISVVKKVDGMSKEQWLCITPYNEYIKANNIKTIYGIAYGVDDINNAVSTLHLVKQQFNDISNFMINKNIIPFIDDINNYSQLINTVMNNY